MMPPMKAKHEKVETKIEQIEYIATPSEILRVVASGLWLYFIWSIYSEECYMFLLYGVK